jgi:hypothetical protein
MTDELKLCPCMFTDADVTAWSDRYDLGSTSILEARCMMEDAATLKNTRAEPCGEAVELFVKCMRCNGTGQQTNGTTGHGPDDITWLEDCDLCGCAGYVPAIVAEPRATAGEDARDAYRKGWIEASKWAGRDDLVSDIGSPAYNLDRDAALSKNNEASDSAATVDHAYKVPDGYVLVPLGSEPDETKFRLMVEDIWAFHKCMDEEGVPREGNGQTLSMYGRACLLVRSATDAIKRSITEDVQAALSKHKEDA